LLTQLALEIFTFHSIGAPPCQHTRRSCIPSRNRSFLKKIAKPMFPAGKPVGRRPTLASSRRIC